MSPAPRVAAVTEGKGTDEPGGNAAAGAGAAGDDSTTEASALGAQSRSTDGNDRSSSHRLPRPHRRRQPLEPEVDTGVPDAEGLPADRPRGVLRRMATGILTYGVLFAVLIFAVGRLRSTNWSEVASSITPAMVIVVLVLGVANMITNAPPVVITLPGLRIKEAFVTTTASSALSNTVPEGGAVATGLNFAMLRSWGHNLPAITSSYLTTGIWTNLVRYGLGAVALWALVASGERGGLVVGGAVVLTVGVAAATVVLGAILRSEGFARGLGAVLGRVAAPFYRLTRRNPPSDMPGEVVGFRDRLVGIVRRRWLALTVAMVASQLTTIAILWAAVRMQGVSGDEVGWPRIVLAVVLMSTASLIVPTPGGVGVAEITLVAVMGAGLSSDLTDSLMIAAALFRLATWLEPIPVGAGSYLFWRRNRSWRHPVTPTPASASA